MVKFSDLISATPERIMSALYKSGVNMNASVSTPIRNAADKLQLNTSQLVCALGFNRFSEQLVDVATVLGLESLEDLWDKRNRVFVYDIYRRLNIGNVLTIYDTIDRRNDQTLSVMQILLKARLENIEKKIEETVNPLSIENYKKEMKAIYNQGIAQIEFAEARLSNTNSGFRALVDEVSIIVDAKLIPVGDIFFRNTVLPQEKRKLMNRGLIPKDLIEDRLEDATISLQERTMLEDFLRLNR